MSKLEKFGLVSLILGTGMVVDGEAVGVLFTTIGIVIFFFCGEE